MINFGNVNRLNKKFSNKICMDMKKEIKILVKNLNFISFGNRHVLKPDLF